ncbi:TRAF family member-associated NF-kappa-B activator isoform X2 [Parambassis ranga]|nr:TRAF family member-associated NF-kappa-B activator-like isoform X2 [Parambassis ranga]XP_028262137.1 TRAF family member-associated NF-kappa-B activator-like isoform X2 [Parambassis ranga]XP_028262138.1 TRAF family member-associated NF-kappa-B activator-like isoform X2 [Parambassis ranga]XP_028262139.1 TRAF family member-associated NF-kappa-B activator-like isoform X2 [Parambassis ranga]
MSCEMEEAYAELYQQFLRLRSLCLKQAALLHQLTTALQRQQGVPNGEVSDVMSIPVQCTHGIPAHPRENAQPLTAATRIQNAELCCVGVLSRNVKTVSDPLSEHMSKLCVDMPRERQQVVNVEERAPFLFTLDSSRCHGPSNEESKHPGQNHPGLSRPPRTERVPVADSPSLVGELLSQPDGPLLSDVALQSHICEFCQAVFPGDTTTRGEFLRHLYTHVT